MNRRTATVIATGATFLLLVVGVTSGGFLSLQGGESSGPVAALAQTTAAVASSTPASAPSTVQGETWSRRTRDDDDDEDEREHSDRAGRNSEGPERRERGRQDR